MHVSYRDDTRSGATPNPTVSLAQGMSYVGCAVKDMQEGSSAHLPRNKHSGSTSNYPWWLTMSCIEDRRLSPVVRIVHALRIWEPEQLPLSEALVTVLAHSLIEDCGFNMYPPGTTTISNSRNWDAEIIEVMDTRKYLPSQLEESAQGLEKAENQLVRLEELEHQVTDKWIDLISKFADVDKLPDTSPEFLAGLQTAVNRRRQTADVMAELVQDVETCVEFFETIIKASE